MSGPDNWPVHYPKCRGEQQSPVNIDTHSCLYDPTLTDFTLINFNRTSSSVDVGCKLNFTNNGHSASVRVMSDMAVEGGGLDGRYRTAEFHFHWGDMDDVGSEHAVDGAKYPLEMHVVSYAEKYGTLMNAMEKPDGLAVLGVLFHISEQDNPAFAPLADTLQYIHKAGEHRTVDGVQLRSLLPEDTSRFWRYAGSLTTPRCYESVTWTIFEQPQKVSVKQLSQLRHLLHEEGHFEAHDHGSAHSASDQPNSPSYLVNNWRPLQPLHKRRVRTSFRTPGQSPVTTQPRDKPEKGSNDILTSGANAQPSPSVTESMMNESRSSLNVTSSPEVTTASLGQDTASQTSGQTSELTSLSHSSVSSTPVPAQKEEQSGHVTTTVANTTGSSVAPSIPDTSPEMLVVTSPGNDGGAIAASASAAPEYNTLSIFEAPPDKIGIPPSALNDGPINAAMERPYLLSRANHVNEAKHPQSTSQGKQGEAQTNPGDSQNILSPPAASIANDSSSSTATTSVVPTAPSDEKSSLLSSREPRLKELSQRLRQFLPQEGRYAQTTVQLQETPFAGRYRGPVNMETTAQPQFRRPLLYSSIRNIDNSLSQPPATNHLLAPHPQQGGGWSLNAPRVTGLQSGQTMNHLLQSLRSSLYVRPTRYGTATDTRYGTTTHTSALSPPDFSRLLHRAYPVFSPAAQVLGAPGEATFDAPFVFLHNFDQPMLIRRRFYGGLNSQPNGLY
ncbi:hypothetical protein C0Q70_06685 [Pomacea canaliculata]|uniref:Carbonic anhydrase n=1 Tax=Pomacea canaliculata TaxID=400727 RepID=A0A2T7PCX0_POMCA|nr:hypothetical protein C0Q70_06685 [Pomacea canaliculata]